MKPFFQGVVPQLRLFDPERHEYANLPAYLVFDAPSTRWKTASL